MSYKLIALDMDGTVLNDNKEITPKTAEAIHTALKQGIEVVFCTGRSYAGMRTLLLEFPDMKYLCGESGALVYDLKQKRVLQQVTFPKEVVEILRDETKGMDLMPVVFTGGECGVNRRDVTHMADFYMGQYQGLYEAEAMKFEDVLDIMVKEERPAEKINCYCGSEEVREILYHRLKERNIPAALVYSEITSLECSPLGLNKAAGLKALCDVLQITMEEVVMVGDADNDLAALQAAGLAIAMGNANENVLKASDVTVADNNHDGCAEAIYLALQK